MTHQNDYTFTDELAGKGLEAVPELLRVLINNAMQAERSRYLQAEEQERTEERIRHTNGYKSKTVKTRVGEVTFVIPQMREGGFYPSALEKGMRSERALLLTLEMYIQGVSTSQQNVEAHVPRKTMRFEVAADIRAMFSVSDRKNAEENLQFTFQKYARSTPQLSAWMEGNLVEGFTIFDFPLEYQRTIRATNNLEQINKEIHRRTKVVGVFPNQASRLRLISALLMEISEEWQIDKCYCAGKSFNCKKKGVFLT